MNAESLAQLPADIKCLQKEVEEFDGKGKTAISIVHEALGLWTHHGLVSGRYTPSHGEAAIVKKIAKDIVEKTVQFSQALFDADGDLEPISQVQKFIVLSDCGGYVTDHMLNEYSILESLKPGSDTDADSQESSQGGHTGSKHTSAAPGFGEGSIEASLVTTGKRSRPSSGSGSESGAKRPRTQDDPALDAVEEADFRSLFGDSPERA
ncbi:hypothetical protein NCC49_005270 [Naganishia albida]|nr:hypothetical protein NCC49_005270 [Naganishia albida]